MDIVVLLLTSHIAISSRGGAVGKRRVSNTTKKPSSIIKIEKRIIDKSNIFSLIILIFNQRKRRKKAD